MQRLDLFRAWRPLQERDDETARIALGFLRKRIVRHDPLPLLFGTNHKVGVKIEALRGLLLQEAFKVGSPPRGTTENQVAALEERSHVKEAECKQEIAQLSHEDRLAAADIDGAQESKVDCHRSVLFFGLLQQTRESGNFNRSRAVLADALTPRTVCGMPKIVRFHQTGGPEVLQLEELPAPRPEKGEVRIKVEAIGLNRAEVMFRNGKYIEEPELPSRLGYEASGTIEEVGPGVTGWKPGDRVSSVPSFSMRNYFTYGEVALLPAHALAKYPENLSLFESTSIWMQYLTAYGLIEFGKMKQGHHVLITAAASSVGLAAIELANAVGAIPIATTRNEAKEEPLRRAGAKIVINTKVEGWVGKVREITSGQGRMALR